MNNDQNPWRGISGKARAARSAAWCVLTLVTLAACSGGQNLKATPPQASPSPQAAGVELSYQVGECDQSGVLDLTESVAITISGRDAQVEQDVRYVCCAKFELTLEQAEDTLRLIETNTGEVCRCFCAYHISAQIRDIPAQARKIQVWGIYYPEMHPLELLGEVDIP